MLKKGAIGLIFIFVFILTSPYILFVSSIFLVRYVISGFKKYVLVEFIEDIKQFLEFAIYNRSL